MLSVYLFIQIPPLFTKKGGEIYLLVLVPVGKFTFAIYFFPMLLQYFLKLFDVLHNTVVAALV